MESRKYRLSVLIQKELKLYFVGSSFYMVSSVLSAGLFLLFRFTYPSDNLNPQTTVSILWSVHLISSLFSLIASGEWEWESNAFRAVKLSGVSGHLVFISKGLASALSILLLWITESVIWAFLYGNESVTLQKITPAAFVVMLIYWLITGAIVSCGLAFLGQITSVLALHSRFRHVLMFIVFFPVSIPLIISASSYTRLILQFKLWPEGQNMVYMQVSFLLFFLAAGVLLYEYLWEE